MRVYNFKTLTNEENLSDREVLEAGADVAAEGLVVMRNRAVYAVLGSGHPEVQDQISTAKGERRGTKQPVGWTVPFTDFSQGAFSLEGIEDPRLKDLIRNPDELTSRLGAIAFVRGAADMGYAAINKLPESIVPSDTKTVQVWSPDGNTAAAYIIGKVLSKGLQPIMTSANVSGEPEAVTLSQALAFAGNSSPPLPVIDAPFNDDELTPPFGSYPVVVLKAGAIEIVRPGCFSPEILKALLYGYKVTLAPAERLQQPKYPDGVLQFSHLPESDRSLCGPELRLGLLAHMGVGRELT